MITVSVNDDKIERIATGTAHAADKLKYVEIKSSNEDVLTVTAPNADAAGVAGAPIDITVKALAVGSANITVKATYDANDTVLTTTIPVTIAASGAEPNLSFTATSYSVVVGATTSAVATPTNLTGGTLTYTSADTKIATISAAGVVTGVAVGSTTITATYTLNAKTYTATATVTVSAPATIVLDKATYSVTVGNTVRALATATTGTPVYSVSDTSIATVNASTGLITGIKAGTVILTATVGTSKATAYVVVSSVKVTLDQSEYTVAAGSAIQAIATSTSGTPVFSVSDTSIATVNATTGVITGIKTGTVILTATVGTEKATAIVTVTGSTPEPVIPSVEEFDYGEGTFELTSDGEATFTGTEKKSGTVTIPAYVYYKVGSKSYTYKVTFIDDGAFRKSKVKKVKVGANVKGIGYKAFAKCRNLEKVAFEDASNIEVIEDKAFNNTKDGCILKQKNGNKFDSEIKSWLEKTFKQLVIK